MTRTTIRLYKDGYYLDILFLQNGAEISKDGKEKRMIDDYDLFDIINDYYQKLIQI